MINLYDAIKSATTSWIEYAVPHLLHPNSTWTPNPYFKIIYCADKHVCIEMIKYQHDGGGYPRENIDMMFYYYFLENATVVGYEPGKHIDNSKQPYGKVPYSPEIMRLDITHLLSPTQLIELQRNYDTMHYIYDKIPLDTLTEAGPMNPNRLPIILHSLKKWDEV
jgi:hypothetical protein